MADIEEIKQRIDELRTEYKEKIKPMIDSRNYYEASNALALYYGYFYNNFTKLRTGVRSGTGLIGVLNSFLTELRNIDEINEEDKEYRHKLLMKWDEHFQACLAQTALPRGD